MGTGNRWRMNPNVTTLLPSLYPPVRSFVRWVPPSYILSYAYLLSYPMAAIPPPQPVQAVAVSIFQF